MIARLFIYPSKKQLKEEITKSLPSHITRGLIAQGSGKLNHPDLLYIKAGEKLGIAEARKIKDHFSLKPYSARGRIVILEDISVMTVEAQNALLKTIEELPREAILVLGTFSSSNLLPTILSRCEIINLKAENDDALEYHSKYIPDLERLLNTPIEERFEYIEKLKDKEAFLQAWVYFFRRQLFESATHKRGRLMKLKEFLKKLLRAEEWAKQNVNTRAILEYLMLEMPALK